MRHGAHRPMSDKILSALLLLGASSPALAQTNTIGEDTGGKKECSGYYENGCKYAYGYHPTYDRHTLKTNCGDGWVTSTGDGDLGLCDK